jgi:hypothetical protein
VRGPRRALGALALGALPLGGCAVPAGEWVYGEALGDLEFHLVSLSMGVHPDQSVLLDPNNPFAEGGLDGDLRWDITSGGLPVPTFYAWATWLTAEPTGEAQFYTAQALHTIYDEGACANEDLFFVRGLAIDAYQAVLDHFPEDVSYDATGTIAYDLAPLAYAGIVELGGAVEGGWIEVVLSDGSTAVVQSP